MSQSDDTRSCPRCDRELQGREHQGEGGLTLIWQCVCGWASARTVSRNEKYDKRRSSSGVVAPVSTEPSGSSTKQRS